MIVSLSTLSIGDKFVIGNFSRVVKDIDYPGYTSINGVVIGTCSTSSSVLVELVDWPHSNIGNSRMVDHNKLTVGWS